MAPFDIKTYYAEQDALMNMPDESLDEIMKRMSSLRRAQERESSRMSPVHNLIETDIAQPGTLSRPDSLPAAEAARPDVPAERSDISMNARPEDSGRTLKRKTSIQQKAMDSGSKRRKSTDLDNSRDNNGDHPQAGTSTKSVPVPDQTFASISDQEMAPPESSPEIEEIESFSVDTPKTQGPTKRKAPLRKADQSPRKQKSRKHISAPQPSEAAAITADHSPISSFSRVLSQSPQTSKNTRRDKVIPVLRNPPLNLRPLRVTPSAPSTSKNKNKKPMPDSIETDGRDSPIEEASLDAASTSKVAKKKGLEGEPSELFLEFRRRIAEHNNEVKKKQGDNVVKPKAKSTVRELTITAAAAQSGDESSIIYVSSSPSSRTSTPGPTGSANAKGKQKATTKKLAKPVVKTMVVKRQAKGKKEKPPQVTPAEYARMLQEAVNKENNGENTVNDPEENAALKSFLLRRKRTKSHHLVGKSIFYAGGDMRYASDLTRGRMDIIVSLGGNIMAEFDPNVTTQIVAETGPYSLLKMIGLKKLDQIPEHIPTVKWTWVLKAMGMSPALPQDEVDDKLGQYFFYAAFDSRFGAGCPYLNRKNKNQRVAKAMEAPTDVGEEYMAEPGPSNSSAEPEANNQLVPSTPIGALLSPPTSPLRVAGPSKVRRLPNAEDEDRPAGKASDADPLAEFYQAADRWKKTDTSSGESDDDYAFKQHQPVPNKGVWTCDKVEPALVGGCPNQDVIDKLEELKSLYEAKPFATDYWRAFSYSGVIKHLKNYPHRIRSVEEARAIPRIGDGIARKIMEIINTGELQRIKYEKTEDVAIIQCFKGIYGVGFSTAYQWYAAGCRTLQDVKERKGGIKLTPAQEIGLKYYDDLQSRMPREEAKALFDRITLIAHNIDPKLSMNIMGSYRRGKPDCGDLDILITRPTEDGNSHSGVLPRLLKKLHDANIITEDLSIPDDSNGFEGSYRGLCHLPNVQGAFRRRIDILCVPWVSRGAAFIYYTGDDIFNRAIRLKARSLGYALNQRGLFRDVIRNPKNPREKLDKGVVVAAETEEEIFTLLNVPWQEPHERVRGSG